MSTEVLQNFIKVYEKKSVTSAAKDLFITPQGLSKTIKQLEMDLEAELFYRGPRGMEATECGELLYARAKHICYLMEDLKKEISIINGRKGLLSVVATYSSITLVPPDLLYRFTEIHPDVQMKLKEVPDEYPVAKLFQEEVEVGLIVGEDGIDKCECELLVPGEVVLVVSKNHPLAEKDEISILELEGEPLILKAVETGKEHGLIDACLEYGFTPNVRHEFGNIATAHKLCEANGLVAVSIDFVEESEAFKDEKLKLIRLKEKIPQNIYLVTRKRDIQSKGVSLFRSYVKDFIKKNSKSF